MLERFVVSVVTLLVVGSCEAKVAERSSGGGGAGGAGVGPSSCEAYFDEGPSGPAVAVNIRNDLDTAIRLSSLKFCSPTEYFFVVRRADGTPGGWPDSESCYYHLTCERKMGGELCPGACALPARLCIEAGEELPLSWPGYLYEPATPPSDCGAGSSCPVRRSAPEASYDFESFADAVAGTAADDCASRSVIADNLTAASKIAYPATTAATLMFE